MKPLEEVICAAVEAGHSGALDYPWSLFVTAIERLKRNGG